MIDNETTQILPGNRGSETKCAQQPINESKTAAPQPTVQNNVADQKSNDTISKAAYAVGGFVAGVAATAAASSMAAGGNAPVAESEEEPELVATVVDEEPEPAVEGAGAGIASVPTGNAQPTEVVDPANSPSEQDVILCTDEGICVAQVDDDKSFAEAFADARAQVGPGGVFEWHGKVYGTYYRSEWDQMSANERAEWQSKIDYADVRNESEPNQYAHHHDSNNHHSDPTPVNHHEAASSRHYDRPAQGESAEAHGSADETLQVVEEPLTPSGEELVDNTPVDGEVHVIGGPEQVAGPDGEMMGVAVLESDGDQLMLVDLDNNGSYDIALHDDNQDGQISQDEVYDASEMNVTVQDIEQLQSQQDGMYYAANDGMPDYSNDADATYFA